MSHIEVVKVATPAAPGDAAAIVLVDTTYFVSGATPATTAVPGGSKGWIQAVGARWYDLTFFTSHASAAAGLKAYSSEDGGTAWKQIQLADPVTGALTSNGISIAATVVNTKDTLRILVELYSDFRVEYTNGATQPTTWIVDQRFICGDGARVT